eukprot:scaffold149608_cov54-Attheya_sp.AAC.1
MTHQLGKFTTQRVLHWRLFLEQYGCTFTYIPGPDNVTADAFSCVPRTSEEESSASKTGVVDAFAIELDDLEMLDCFLMYPIFNDEDPQEYPLDYQTIQHYQQNDEHLQEANERLPIKFPRIQNRRHYQYSFYHPKIRERAIALCSKCDACQRYKANNRGYGHPPPREADMAPWREVAVDLIGPWKVKLGHLPVVNEAEAYVTFNALTCIDPVTNLTELIRIEMARLPLI